MLAVSAPGFVPWNFVFPIAIAVTFMLFHRFIAAAFLMVAAAASGLSVLAKYLVQRPRPIPDLVKVVHNLNSYSFPSGHVTEYALVFGFTFYLVFTLMKPGLLRTLILVLCAGMIFLVAPSRIWMGQHWASDTLGGYALGFGLLMLVIWGYRRWQRYVTERS